MMYDPNLVEHESMSQEEVCKTLRHMDSKIISMFKLMMDCSNVLETEISKLAINYLDGKKYRSPKFYGKIYKYVLPIIKLKSIKDYKLLKIVDKIQLTRDTSIEIINLFIHKTKKYKELSEELANISYDFYKNGSNAVSYTKIRSKMIEIENNISGDKESLYGSILNVESICKDYYMLRNKILLAYLKLSSGAAYRLTTKYDDSFQNGLLGIIHAIDMAKVSEMEKKLYSFANFVKWHVKNAITNNQFNIRTDLVFNIRPQVLKKMCSEDKDCLKKLRGENIIEYNDLMEYPKYPEDHEKDNILDNEEINLISLLKGDPASCIFDSYPTEEEILKEKIRQRT